VGLNDACRRLCTMCCKHCAWHWCIERSETPKSSPVISEQSPKLAKTAAECHEEPSSPRASAVPPDSDGSSVAEEEDETDVADPLPSTSEADA